ncbi:HEAT repeat domain-containing protein [uncultured Methanolobus sp.]|uniref:HEAT repeat domain-containing protein n=1 Tax=uncultured Methanolobus sp. TaxID=218300 RepID=UPI0037489CDF
MTSDVEERVRISVALAIGSSFEHVPDRSAAWSDLHQLTSDKNVNVKRNAALAIGSAFDHIPDRSAAWSDLHRLTNNIEERVRIRAALAIGSAFEHVPDKDAAWSDLYRLTSEESSDVRKNAALASGSAFEHVPDKDAAWFDLHRLASDKQPDVRKNAALTIGSAFRHIPDKYAAWSDLYRLTSDESSDVRGNAALASGSAFEHVPDKGAAWFDLHRLISNDLPMVRISAASAIVSSFEHVPDKDAAWSDLHCLASDEYSYVKMYANHFLGKICIYKASKSENEVDAQILISEAIHYFEKAANQTINYLEKVANGENPAKFCNLFYRSLNAVLFEKKTTKKEIDAYISAAKREIRGSRSKQKLLEAVEQLAKVLETAQNARESGFDYQELLKRCSDICGHVDQLMDENREKTPAIHDLYDKFRPSFRRTIKELIDEVKQKAEEACKEAKGTDAEFITCSINNQLQKWEVGSQEQMEKNLDNVIFSLKTKVPNISKNKSIIDKIDAIKSESKVENQMVVLSTLIGLLPSLSLHEDICKIKEKTEKILDNIDQLIASIEKIEISFKPGIKEEIQVTVGLSGLGNGAQHVITIPLQEISYAELREDLKIYSSGILNITKLPVKLKDNIIDYIRKNKNKLEEKVPG